jgi:hypothetical protein
MASRLRSTVRFRESSGRHLSVTLSAHRQNTPRPAGSPSNGAQNRPYEESLELNRLVLLDEVPANAETWLQARAFRLAAGRGICGIVAPRCPPV